MPRKKQPAYSSTKGRVNKEKSIDEKIADAKRELGLTDKPKSFTSVWDRVVFETRMTFNNLTQTA